MITDRDLRAIRKSSNRLSWLHMQRTTRPQLTHFPTYWACVVYVVYVVCAAHVWCVWCVLHQPRRCRGHHLLLSLAPDVRSSQHIPVCLQVRVSNMSGDQLWPCGQTGISLCDTLGCLSQWKAVWRAGGRGRQAVLWGLREDTVTNATSAWRVSCRLSLTVSLYSESDFVYFSASC